MLCPWRHKYPNAHEMKKEITTTDHHHHRRMNARRHIKLVKEMTRHWRRSKKKTNPITVSQLHWCSFFFLSYFLKWIYLLIIFVKYFVRLFRLCSIVFVSSSFFSIFFWKHTRLKYKRGLFWPFYFRLWLEWVWIRRCTYWVYVCRMNASPMPMNVFIYIEKLTYKPCQRTRAPQTSNSSKWVCFNGFFFLLRFIILWSN